MITVKAFLISLHTFTPSALSSWLMGQSETAVFCTTKWKPYARLLLQVWQTPTATNPCMLLWFIEAFVKSEPSNNAYTWSSAGHTSDIFSFFSFCDAIMIVSEQWNRFECCSRQFRAFQPVAKQSDVTSGIADTFYGLCRIWVYEPCGIHSRV